MKIIAYRLEPVYEVPPGRLVTAAVMQCLATGKVLSGSGGGGEYLDPEIVEALRDGGESKVIITATEHDRLVERDARLTGLED